MLRDFLPWSGVRVSSGIFSFSSWVHVLSAVAFSAVNPSTVRSVLIFVETVSGVSDGVKYGCLFFQFRGPFILLPTLLSVG
jgi:hypothetical protein